MLRDKESNRIQLVDEPNGHILVLGSSGQGKTYFCCRELEERIRRKHKVIVFDFSGSYRGYELVRNQMEESEKEIQTLNPYERPWYFSVTEDNEKRLCKNIVDALISVLKIQSYTQKKFLSRAVDECIETYSVFNIFALIEKLEMYLESDRERKEDMKEMEKLLSKFVPYEEIDKIYIRKRNKEERESRFPVTIIQLSDFPEQQRQFLTEFLLTIIWKETLSNGQSPYHLILLDEAQHLSMKSGSALCGFLQEGRKFGVSVMLTTQFMSCYKRDEQNLLLQAASILFFRVTFKEAAFCAKLISGEEWKEWKKILCNLETGETVLLGKYRINNYNRVCNYPVVCKVLKKNL
jgi:DNA helicase HerA-like ATPase